MDALSDFTVYNVKTAGAIGDGTNDDTVAIQDAINQAVAIKGGVAFFPPGKYLITSTLRVNGLATLLGSGWNTGSADVGSYIYFKDTFIGNAIEVTERSVTIDQLAFACDQPVIQADWSPNDFGGGYAIKVKADDVTLRNVFLFNVTRGVDLSNSTGSVGRINLDRIYGQPLKLGVKVDNALDVVKVNNVHFWPFWNSSREVKLYQLQNATGLLSCRSDNPFYSNIFCLHYHRGMHFSASQGQSGNSGITSKFKVINADLDFCETPFSITGNGTTGQLCNFSCQGPDAGDPNDGGIKIMGNDIHLQATDVYITHFEHNGIRVEGSGSVLLVDNVWINAWDRLEGGFPGIEVVEGASAFVGATRLFNNNHTVSPLSGNIQLAKLETLTIS